MTIEGTTGQVPSRRVIAFFRSADGLWTAHEVQGLIPSIERDCVPKEPSCLDEPIGHTEDRTPRRQYALSDRLEDLGGWYGEAPPSTRHQMIYAAATGYRWPTGAAWGIYREVVR